MASEALVRRLPGPAGIGLDVLPLTLRKQRKGMRRPQNLNSVACLVSKGAPPAYLSPAPGRTHTKLAASFVAPVPL